MLDNVLKNRHHKRRSSPRHYLMEAGNDKAKFDMFLMMNDSRQGLNGRLEYNTDLFETATAARMVTNLKVLLGQIVESPDQKLSKLAFFSGEKSTDCLNVFTDKL